MRHTARAIVIKDNQLLLMERWRDNLHYFSIPGGGIEPGETAEQAAIRELQEEMSVAIKPLRVLYNVHTPDKEHTIFLADYQSGEAMLHPNSPEARTQLMSDNKFKPRWIATKDVAELPFMYWQPIQQQLVHDIATGFSDKPIDISYKS